MSCLQELYAHITPGTFFFFDIGDTLILNRKHNIPITVINPDNLYPLISAIKQAHLPIIALSIKDLDIEYQQFTFKQLENFKIHFTDVLNAHTHINCIFINSPQTTALYNKGILFLNGTHANKGHVLKLFLESLSIPPVTVVMVDDKPSNNDDITRALSTITIAGIKKIILYDYPYVKNKLVK